MVKLPSWCILLLEILKNENNNSSIYSLALKMTYAHCVNQIHVLESNGLITILIDGRRKNITLTEKGKIMANSLNIINEIIGKVDNKNLGIIKDDIKEEKIPEVDLGFIKRGDDNDI